MTAIVHVSEAGSKMASRKMSPLILALIITVIGIIQFVDCSPACESGTCVKQPPFEKQTRMAVKYSMIWCHGPLLRDVQMAGLYPDSKTFVDMSLKANPETVLSAYSNLSKGVTPSSPQLKSFLDEYFDGPGTEFEKWTPTDYVERPAFLKKIKDKKLRQFGSELCKIWSHLGRKIKDDVKVNQDRYSLIYLENPFIVPGGRFREIYYWDSYWVVQGLLTCEMKTTVKGMLENLISFVKRYGLVPNGGRIYYTRRSQPPLLIPMVDLYVKATGDVQFLRDNLDYLVKEYKFWMGHRVFMGMNRYAAYQTTPRPESYSEDFKHGASISYKGESKDQFFSHIASAAESGWDFSTRWFGAGYQKKQDKATWLQSIETKDVLPVDLNSIMCWNEKLISNYYHLIGNKSESSKWLKKHSSRVMQLEKTFWNEEKGSWFDYSISNKRHRNTSDFFPSSVFPLFTECIDADKSKMYKKKTIKYLKDSKVIGYESGIPTSLTNSGQQWDFTNAWPPLQHIIITAVARGGDNKMALELSQKWVESNYIGWKRTGKMFEKYIVTAKGSRGGGGEYDVQEGFGWTNGVILDLLDTFGEDLKIHGSTSGATFGPVTRIPTLLICILFNIFMHSLI